VAASKSTLSDLKEAKAFLSEASRLDIDDMQLGLVHKKMEAVDKQIAALKAKKTAAKTPAPVHESAPPAKTEAPAHAAPAPAPHAKPHG